MHMYVIKDYKKEDKIEEIHEYARCVFAYVENNNQLKPRLHLAYDKLAMIFAFSRGLRRVTLRCLYDSTASYDLRSLYDFVV